MYYYGETHTGTDKQIASIQTVSYKQYSYESLFYNLTVDGGVAYAGFVFGTDNFQIEFGTHSSMLVVINLSFSGSYTKKRLIELAQEYLNSMGTWGEFKVVDRDDEDFMRRIYMELDPPDWSDVKVTSDRWMKYLPKNLKSFALDFHCDSIRLPPVRYR